MKHYSILLASFYAIIAGSQFKVPDKWGLLGSPYGGGGGGTLIFSYIRRLGSFYGVQNFEFLYFGGFQRNEYFLGGMKISLFKFWGHHRIGLYLGVISLVLRSRYRTGDIFWVAKISNIFWGA